jgi:hypothetical protein
MTSRATADWSPQRRYAMVAGSRFRRRLRAGLVEIAPSGPGGSKMRTPMLCAALVLMCPVLAHAQSAAAAMQDFGLLGTWAGECSQDAGPTNNHATYLVTSSGGLQLKYQSGADYEDSVYDILDAKRIAPDKLSLRQVLMSNDRVALDIVLLKDNDKIRIWSSLFPDGTALVEDGVMTSMTGRETRWMTRCP